MHDNAAALRSAWIDVTKAALEIPCQSIFSIPTMVKFLDLVKHVPDGCHGNVWLSATASYSFDPFQVLSLVFLHDRLNWPCTYLCFIALCLSLKQQKEKESLSWEGENWEVHLCLSQPHLGIEKGIGAWKYCKVNTVSMAWRITVELWTLWTNAGHAYSPHPSLMSKQTVSWKDFFKISNELLRRTWIEASSLTCLQESHHGQINFYFCIEKVGQGDYHPIRLSH